jgi:hypothetical protein
MSKWGEIATPRPRPRFILAACRRCGGDGLLDLSDGAEWRCLQCGRTVAEEPGVYAAALAPNRFDFNKVAGRPAA